MKIITVCGSYKFKKEALLLDKMHKEKIRLSDAILVVDVDGK